MDKRINVRFFDKNLNFIGETDSYIGLEFINRWFTYGEFKLFVFEITPQMQQGNFIMLDNDRKKTGIIKRVHCSDSDDSSFEIDGFTLIHLLTQRLTYPPIGQAYHTFHAPAENIICSLVIANAVDSWDTKRNIPFLEVKESLGRGDVLHYQTRYDNLCDSVNTLCECSGLGVVVSLNPEKRKIIFEVLEGIDRSSEQNEHSPMIFNVEYDNISNREYISDMSEYKNCAVTAGQGEGADRKISIVGDENTGIDRYELFVDARDIENDSQLPDRGKSKLTEHICIDSYSSDADGSLYGEKWNIGDIVATIDREYSVHMNERIVEVIETFDSNGYAVSLTFGTVKKTILDKVQDVGKDEPLIEGIKGDPGEQGEQGLQGPQGYSMQYRWDGTNLGVKREDETTYKYANLQGPKGEQGSAPQMMINSDGHLIAIYD